MPAALQKWHPSGPPPARGRGCRENKQAPLCRALTAMTGTFWDPKCCWVSFLQPKKHKRASIFKAEAVPGAEFSREAALQRDVTQGNPLRAAPLRLRVWGLAWTHYPECIFPTAASSPSTFKQLLHPKCKPEQFPEHSAEKKKNKPHHLRKLKCKDYMRFLCIIIFSLHAPSPLFLFVSKSSKETEQQRTWALMLIGKHPKNKATGISGNFRTSCAKIIYQVHTGGARAAVWVWHWLWVSDWCSDPKIIPCSQTKLRRRFLFFFFPYIFLHIPLLGKQNQSRALTSFSQLLLNYFQIAAVSQKPDTTMFEPNVPKWLDRHFYQSWGFFWFYENIPDLA